tara:strand:+ start:393 stop:1004 length:612 start_codon:yes stop_codon:yes gene_type:complete
MADLKISALPAASVALAGTEVLPIVQSSATKQVTVANLTAGRAVATGALTVTGDATLSTGNIVPATAAKGINFTANTPAAGMTSQLLNWYEEGTWTPVVTSLGGTITSYTASGTYTRIGREVTASFRLLITNNGTGNGALYATLPFNGSSVVCTGAGRENAVVGLMLQLVTVASDPRVTIYTYNNLYPAGTGYEILGTITYFV